MRKINENQKEENQETQESGKETLKYLWIIALVLILGLGYYFVSKGRVENQPARNEEGSRVPGEENLIAVSDYTVGKTVIASNVILAEEGFVVVHEDSQGKPGKILGSSILLPAGESLEVRVDLSRESKNGEVLYAMLHKDDGDGRFVAIGDSPVLDSQGNQMTMIFTIGAFY